MFVARECLMNALARSSWHSSYSNKIGPDGFDGLCSSGSQRYVKLDGVALLNVSSCQGPRRDGVLSNNAASNNKTGVSVGHGGVSKGKISMYKQRSHSSRRGAAPAFVRTSPHWCAHPSTSCIAIQIQFSFTDVGQSSRGTLSPHSVTAMLSAHVLVVTRSHATWVTLLGRIIHKGIMQVTCGRYVIVLRSFGIDELTPSTPTFISYLRQVCHLCFADACCRFHQKCSFN